MADDAVAVYTNTLLYFLFDDMHYDHVYIMSMCILVPGKSGSTDDL